MIEAETLTGNIETNELTGTLDKYVQIIEPILQEKESTPTKQTQQITPDENYNGLSQVTVNPIPDEYIIPALDSKTITNNGEYYAVNDNLNGYSSVNVNVQQGGKIIGTLVPKTIQSGSISKGDFVKRGTFAVQDRLTQRSNYRLVNGASISDESKLFDNDDNTYATISYSSGSPRIYIQCKSRQELNIPSDALIKSIVCSYKIGWDNYSGTRSAFPQKFVGGDLNTTFTAGLTKAYTSQTERTPVIDSCTFYDEVLVPTDDTNRYGFQTYSANMNNSIRLYYAKFDIVYEADNQITKVTSNGDYIVGVANENGTQGDTINIYVPE